MHSDCIADNVARKFCAYKKHKSGWYCGNTILVTIHAKTTMKPTVFKLFLSAILLCLCMTSCKKKVDENYRPEFVGKWHSDIPGEAYNYIGLEITENSQADYMIYWEGNATHHKGTARANDNQLKIGRILYLKIVEYPHKIDTAVEKHGAEGPDGSWRLANWKMTLSGIKPEWLLHLSFLTDYYKADY